MAFRAVFTAVTTSVALVGALTAMSTTPAPAAPATPTSATGTPAAGTANSGAAGAAGATTWHTTTSRGGLIRECYKESCDWYYRTSPGDKLLWSHNAYNEFGNLWYYVDSGFTRGWIYCGNVTAGC
ncbi:hypothetical protein AB0I16_21265 [Streptomyces sp. NPDC050703]|uniref:hypothetical protein n=1 Tax=Streptomyces sp. NPDC050703 TaxID=3157218 RepID=UPI003414D75B